MKKLLLLIGLAIAASAHALPTTNSPSLCLAWDASTDPTIAGYRIYWGAASRNYTNVVDAGTNTMACLTNFVRGITYYFAATCYNTNALESTYSAETTFQWPNIPNAPTNLRIAWDYDGLNTNLVFDVWTSTNLAHWTLEATTTNTAWTVPPTNNITYYKVRTRDVSTGTVSPWATK